MSVLQTHPWHQQEQFSLGFWPTPLEPLLNLSKELGGPTIWVKRDDCTGLAVGGNKTRKLEYLLGEALSEGADTVVTFGAVQSNHARQTAAACAKAGLTCHQILSRTVASNNPGYESNGNVLLGQLLGAHQHLVDTEQTKTFTRELLARLEGTGQNPYIIPAGGSNELGALGYARCAEELVQQALQAGIELTYVVHASSSAGTQAGLLYGLAHLESAAEVLGINVYHADPAILQQRINELLERMSSRFGAAKTGAVQVNNAYYGNGYGQPTEECLSALRMAASLEGLLFDPVYSGKALAGLIDQINLGNLKDHEHVVLIHTGGSPALYVYDQVFSQGASE